MDLVARAALRAEPEDAESIASLTSALEVLDARCAAWFAAVHASVVGARADVERGALDAVVTRLGELTELLVRGVAPGVPPEPVEHVAPPASAQGPLVDDDFIDFSGETTSKASQAFPETEHTDDEAVLIDLRALPTFETEARDHLDQADVQLLALETSPANEEALNALFRCMHTLKGSSAIIGLTPIKALAHEAEQILELARARKLRIEGAASDILFETVDELRRILATIAAAGSERAPDEARPDPRILGALRRIVGAAGAGLVGDSLQPPPPDASADDKAPRGAGLRLVRNNDTVRVDAERLDRFVDAIGELVIAESMVAHSPDLRESPLFAKLARPIGQLDKIARTLQEMATSLRMVAVRDTFQRMHRTARDVARRCGKSVSLTTSGEGTELDKAVVDQLADPLMHLVRNAVDHGIETREERIAAGKPETGRIELRAIHAGDEVHIEVADDGRGLVRERILAKGIERGLVREGDTLTDSQVFSLVFEPGFSTAQAVTDISGRGVGTDVVKQTVEALRGRVEVRSEPGHGSVFTLRLPLTMAVIDGMLVAVGTHRYIVPTLSVVRTVQCSHDEVTELLGAARTMELNGKWIPVCHLAELLAVPQAETRSEHELVVVVEHGGRRLGLVVDQLLGQQQIVIKSLGSAVEACAVAGGAILPDGTVGLVLELADLLSLSGNDSHAAA